MSGSALALFVLMVAVGLAGCASNHSLPSATHSSTTSVPTPGVQPVSVMGPVLGPSFELSDCRNRGGSFSVPRSNLDGILPEGFEAVASTDPTAPPDSVVVYAIAVSCAAFRVNGTEGKAVELAYAEVAVTPSTKESVPGITDCTMPLFFVATDEALGAALHAHGLGLAGTGTLGTTAIETSPGARTDSYTLGDGSLQFIFGETTPDTLGVTGGDFMLYGVQGGHVVSRLQGTSEGGTAHYASAMVQSTGVPGLTGFRDAALGFGASGFSLHFRPLAPAP